MIIRAPNGRHAIGRVGSGNMKHSTVHLKKIIDEVLYLRKVMIYEIRYMGEDLLEKMETEK